MDSVGSLRDGRAFQHHSSSQGVARPGMQAAGVPTSNSSCALVASHLIEAASVTNGYSLHDVFRPLESQQTDRGKNSRRTCLSHVTFLLFLPAFSLDPFLSKKRHSLAPRATPPTKHTRAVGTVCRFIHTTNSGCLKLSAALKSRCGRRQSNAGHIGRAQRRLSRKFHRRWSNHGVAWYSASGKTCVDYRCRLCRV